MVSIESRRFLATNAGSRAWVPPHGAQAPRGIQILCAAPSWRTKRE